MIKVSSSLRAGPRMGGDCGPARKARCFVLPAFPHERSILIGYLLSESSRAKIFKMASNKVFITEALDKLAIESGHVFQLKTEQEQTVDCLLEGRDVFAVMPTGYGKSLVFQVFVKAMNCRKASQAMEANTVVLVICPLTSIIEDQVKEGESLGLKCVTLDEFMDGNDRDKHQIVFASAEHALSKKFTEMLRDRLSQICSALELLVVDESHTVEMWTGKSFEKYVCTCFFLKCTTRRLGK